VNKVTCFSVHDFERERLLKVGKAQGLSLNLLSHRLDEATAELVHGSRAVMTFASDQLSEPVLKILKDHGVEMISLRSAGFSHLDVKAAQQMGFTVARVPAYSPEAIAEHAVALMLCLNRKLIHASRRVRELNFKLDGLEGFTVFGKTVGVIGAGHIGLAFVRIMSGFGCKVLIYDPYLDPTKVESIANVEITDLKSLCQESDIISLHCPLNQETHYIISEKELGLMKPHVLLINTGRGGLINTAHLISAIKQKQVGGVALDVYEHEEGVFFHDYSAEGIDDDTLARLLTFPNVVVTSHQAFFTHEALNNIAQISIGNVATYFAGGSGEIESDNILVNPNP
jgi:D-lactate dehydrogenase